MKRRIFIQGTLVFSSLALLLIFFGFLTQIWVNESVDEWMDSIGLLIAVFGFFIRISARMHKAENSKNSHELVTSGLYGCTRNPMYLGSFLIGCGAVLSLLKPWAIFIFAAGYFLVYVPQVRKEERELLKVFGESYRSYCRMVPRTFPKMTNILIFLREAFPRQWSWFGRELVPLSVFLSILTVLLTAKDMHSYGFHELWDEPLEIIAAVAGMIGLAWLRITIFSQRGRKDEGGKEQ